jgi:hypothetical protein
MRALREALAGAAGSAAAAGRVAQAGLADAGAAAAAAGAARPTGDAGAERYVVAGGAVFDRQYDSRADQDAGATVVDCHHDSGAHPFAAGAGDAWHTVAAELVAGAGGQAVAAELVAGAADR